MVGLRPYRPVGFVVRAEAFGDKRLVHNYGHGGSGITLSWGTSRLTVDLGLSGHSGPVAVIGAGVVGLSTLRLVQKAGFDVTVYAKALPPDTTSNIAGGQWRPSDPFDETVITAAWRQQYLAATEYSWRRFQTLVGDDYGHGNKTLSPEDRRSGGGSVAPIELATRISLRENTFGTSYTELTESSGHWAEPVRPAFAAGSVSRWNS